MSEILSPGAAFALSRRPGGHDFRDYRISENFTWSEVFWNRNQAEILEATLSIFQNALKQARLMQAVRAHLRATLDPKAVISVSSWWRSPSANRRIPNAAPMSQHLLALATDFVVPGYETIGGNRRVQAALLPVKKQLGCCVEVTGGGWTHVDDRDAAFAFRPGGHVLTPAEEKAFIKAHGVRKP